MNLILWVVLFALIGLGKYAIGEIKRSRKTKGIALLIITIILMIAWFAVNVLPPREAGASCFNENSATDSKELRRLTLSPQA